MIQPTIGVFTAFGTAHRHQFADAEEQLVEKLRLFRKCSTTLIAASVALSPELLIAIHGQIVPQKALPQVWMTPGYEPMIGLVEALGRALGLASDEIDSRLADLPQLALRMETFGGINGTTIINDTYNLDTDALTEALHYQRRLAGDRNRVVVIGLSETTQFIQQQLSELIAGFHPHAVFFIQPGGSIPWEQIADSVVLVKGSRELGFEKEVSKGRELKHRTIVEIDLGAIRHNVQYFRKRLKPSTKILCMVKASSYGSGAERVAAFLQQEGADYFGVAFADEGIALREAGITAPIVVMNADPEHAGVIIDYRLEPAIYSFNQLDTFVTALIHHGKSDYPVHLKFDTGMHRLGFSISEKEQVLATVSAQPEIRIQGIYSHLADADNLTDSSFTLQQIAAFETVRSYFEAHMPYPFLAHLLNSEGALHYQESQYDMIRLGIVLYGYSGDPKLQAEMQPSVQWKSAVSQVKPVPAGESVGYGCTFRAETAITIAVVPVGYADGFRRSLSNGKGAVYIHGNRCAVVGRVCMDMIMVDVTGLNVVENDEVEIIGPHQSMADFARAMETIPYEVMTGLSRRMHRIYVED
jgi:alanine racemase